MQNGTENVINVATLSFVFVKGEEFIEKKLLYYH